ncbi:GntR family transcriptional regulator [Alkalimarinus sediminis]|uniref:GntR family transcriptional regulator n=1 Tax=Alkalimarinus sediminis TaxID=1632866 RepID=A0A9E8KPF4_9ALTE|nr:GntR family transcriptional regulator [Alkalimarinus sediminis]UZW74689.1 GntR family transcriptional regulator [Alkalimarinus sediminis]
MMQFKPKETLTEQVATHIENLIAFNQLKGGQRIYEGPMAKELSVSHGSVREALLLLEKKHLVRSIPRKGTFVTELDEHFVKSLYEAILMYLTNTSIKLIRQWKQEDIDQMEHLYTQMSECFNKGQLMEFLDLGIEYTQASLAYADNYFIVSAIQDLWPSAKRCAFVALQQGTPVLKENLEHMRHSLDTIKERNEEELIKILEEYADQQCRQVLQCIA